MAAPQPPRTPPRFVPTLTEVVQVPGVAPAAGAAPAPPRTTVIAPPPPTGARQGSGSAAASAAVPATRPPLPSARPPAVMMPRSAAPQPSAVAAAAAPAAAPAAPQYASPLQQQSAPARAGTVVSSKPPGPDTAPRTLAGPVPHGFEEYMVHRVMQRVDVVLEQRLRDAIATVVHEQTRSVLPRLREEIESVVRNAVYEAVADELQSGSAKPSGR